MSVLDGEDPAAETSSEPFELLPEEIELLSLTATAKALPRIRRQLALSTVPVAVLVMVFGACAISVILDLA